MRDLQQTGFGLDGSGEGAFFVPKQFGLKKIAGEPATVEVHESLFGAAAVLVNPARENALPRSRLSLDQNRALRGRNPGGHFGQLPDGRAGPEKRIDPLAAPPAVIQGLLATVSLILETSLQHHRQSGQIHWLGKKVLRTQLDGLHGQIDGRVPGHEDNRDGGVHCVQPGKNLQSVSVGEAVIQYNGVRFGAAVDLLGLPAAGAGDDLESSVFEETLDRRQELGLVVNNQNPAVSHACSQAPRLGGDGSAPAIRTS